MSEQIYFEDVAEGREIGPLEKHVTTTNIFMYLAAIWLLDRIHYDYPFATQRRGLPYVVEPGNMALDYYGQLLTDWEGKQGELRRLSVQYRGFRIPGDTLQCKGTVTNKYIKDRKGYVELELLMLNQNGINCAPGKAVVELPIRGA